MWKILKEFGFKCDDVTMRDMCHCIIQTQHDTGLHVDRLTTASGHSSAAYTKSYGNPDMIGMLSEQKRYVDAYVYL